MTELEKADTLPSRTVELVKVLDEWYPDVFPEVTDMSEKELYVLYGKIELVRDLKQKLLVNND